MPENSNTYELTYIVNAVLSEDQARELAARYNTYIEENGGRILHSEAWGSRRLAYPIAKKRNGYYFNVYFQAPGRLIPRLERAMEIEDDVLRYLTLAMDAKMIRHFEKSQGAAPVASADAE